MSLEAIRRQLEDLNADFSDILTDKVNNRYPILDGAINLDQYFKSRIRIMWLMKEPYDEEDGMGGGWSFFDACQEPDFVKGLVFGNARPTWQPVIYVSYGILNNLLWDEMDYIRRRPEMIDVIQKIAWVNIQKLPSRNVARTDMRDVVESYLKHRHLLSKQIELLRPHVIICANTLQLIQEDYDLAAPIKVPGVEYYLKGDQLFIHAYHPAQTTISRQLYVDSIVGVVNAYMKY